MDLRRIRFLFCFVLQTRISRSHLLRPPYLTPLLWSQEWNEQTSGPDEHTDFISTSKYWWFFLFVCFVCLFFVVPLLPSPSLACYLQGFFNITSHMTSSQVSKQPHQCYQASGQRARSTERQCSEKNSLDLPGANRLGNLLWSTQQIFKEEKKLHLQHWTIAQWKL